MDGQLTGPRWRVKRKTAQRLDDAIAWCAGPESGPELRRLLKMLGRWRNEILAHHRTVTSIRTRRPRLVA